MGKVDKAVDKSEDTIVNSCYPQMLGAKYEHFAPIYPQGKLNVFNNLGSVWAYPRSYYYY